MFFTLEVEILLMCLVIILNGCCHQISDKKELKARKLQFNPQSKEEGMVAVALWL